jgi:hypothetical protein
MTTPLSLPVDYHEDDRIEAAGEAAEILLIRARCLMKERSSDGGIGALQVRRLGLSNAEDRAAALVSAGLWETTDTGWRDSAFLTNNASAAELDAMRSKFSAGGRWGMHKRWHADKPDPECDYCPSDKPGYKPSNKGAIARRGDKGRREKNQIDEQEEERAAENDPTYLPSDPSLSFPPPSSPAPDLAHGFALYSEYVGELSEKQLGIIDEWTAERGGDSDWLAAIAAAVPDDFYAAVSDDHRRWRRNQKRRGSRAANGNGWTPSAADLQLIEDAHR